MSSSIKGVEPLNRSHPFSFQWRDNEEAVVFAGFSAILILSNAIAFVLRQHKNSLADQTGAVIRLNGYIIEMLNISATLTVSFLNK